MRSVRKSRIGLILALAFAANLPATDPPRDIARRVAARETENKAARENYTYRQTVVIEEMDARGGRSGEFRLQQDIIFSPKLERTEKQLGKPVNTLRRLQLTEEDFRDLREVQPFLFTAESLWLYETRYKGEETVDGIECFVLSVKPRQVLDGQRLFEGVLWAGKEDFSVVRTYGQAVPQLLGRKKENLFPRFTTLRERVDDKHWFPIHTHADDVLPFSGGPLRMKMTVRYENYKRFQSEVKIKYEGEK